MAALSPHRESSGRNTLAPSAAAPCCTFRRRAPFGAHAARDADACGARVARCGQQLFGQYLCDAPLKAGGHTGHVHLFARLAGAVHRVQHRGFQAGKADVVRALHMGRGQGVGLFASALRGLWPRPGRRGSRGPACGPPCRRPRLRRHLPCGPARESACSFPPARYGCARPMPPGTETAVQAAGA